MGAYRASGAAIHRAGDSGSFSQARPRVWGNRTTRETHVQRAASQGRGVLCARDGGGGRVPPAPPAQPVRQGNAPAPPRIGPPARDARRRPRLRRRDGDRLLAELVGPDGQVVGIDASADQLAQARQRVNPGDTNTSFLEASATDTGLPPGSFDLVYCRFLLLHLPQPERALREMHALLRPNGILVCEDGDLTTAGSEPPSALRAFAELFGRLGPVRGVDYTLGRRLFHMVAAAGFPAPEISYNQPVVARGENKRLLELSVAEVGPALLDAGLITAEELNQTLAEMRRLSADGSVLAVMPRMAQVWARKPADPCLAD